MCEYSTGRYFLRGSAARGGLGAGRHPACPDYTERCGKPAQPHGDLRRHYLEDEAKLPTHVEIEAGRYEIVRDSVILLEQLRTIDKRRLKDRVCHLDEDALRQVDRALQISLELLT